MGLNYATVLWNPQKKAYDKIIALVAIVYIILFVGLTFAFNPNTSIETLVIRTFGSLAILLLHIILAIGPLARLHPKFLPLLYNRRHLGVSMFLAALIHGGFSLFQFHFLGDVNPIYSVFASNTDYASIANFPFQVLGFIALCILYLMAATSHDFWLHNLSPKTWKNLHMMVYVAYVLIMAHVFLGAFQQETSFLSSGILILGCIAIMSLHLISGFKERKIDALTSVIENDWQYVCEVDDILEDRAKMVTVEKERIAIFKYDGKLSAIHNVCKHQGGPLGEGKVVDGCVTCPWHGYQYLPENGQSPPPFTEKVATYALKLEGSKIYVNPKANPEGTPVEPIKY